MKRSGGVDFFLGGCLALALWACLITAVIYTLGCASVAPEVVTQKHVETSVVSVPSPVPCINAEDIPDVPPIATVDAKNATTDQLAAASAANAEAYRAYALAVSKLFAQCAKTGGTK